MLAGAKTASIRPRAIGLTAVILGILSSAESVASAVEPDPRVACTSCEAWNMPHEPFRVYGNTYYVGVAGLSVILIASNKGLILLDGALPQSAPLIAASIAKLGFRVEEIRLIVNTHTHFDHAGGIAALQRASGALVAASPSAARALEAGRPTDDDPLFGLRNNGFPPVQSVGPFPPMRLCASENWQSLRASRLDIHREVRLGHGARVRPIAASISFMPIA